MKCKTIISITSTWNKQGALLSLGTDTTNDTGTYIVYVTISLSEAISLLVL